MDIMTDKFRISIDDDSGGESVLEITAISDEALAALLARVNACFWHLLETNDLIHPARDIERPVLHRASLGDYLCPVCASIVMKADHYCGQCGQKLAWTKEQTDG